MNRDSLDVCVRDANLIGTILSTVTATSPYRLPTTTSDYSLETRSLTYNVYTTQHRTDTTHALPHSTYRNHNLIAQQHHHSTRSIHRTSIGLSQFHIRNPAIKKPRTYHRVNQQTVDPSLTLLARSKATTTSQPLTSSTNQSVSRSTCLITPLLALLLLESLPFPPPTPLLETISSLQELSYTSVLINFGRFLDRVTVTSGS
jgi:hypothetical protein